MGKYPVINCCLALNMIDHFYFLVITVMANVSIPTQNIKKKHRHFLRTQTRTMIVDKIYWIKAAERTKSRNYRLHLVRKLYFLCFIFMENATGTPMTLAKVELKLVGLILRWRGRILKKTHKATYNCNVFKSMQCL